MTVVLIGAPASGKTRVGKRLAKRLEREFIDTDREIVEQHGPIAEIFANDGERAFRAIERAEVARALTSDAIVSLGGGAVLDLDTRADLAHSTVVLLTITAEAAEPRLTGGKRPLVDGIESWQRLVDSRAELYASLADFTIDTSTRPIDAIVDDIARWVEETT